MALPRVKHSHSNESHKLYILSQQVHFLMSGRAGSSNLPVDVAKGFATGIVLYSVPACVIGRSLNVNLRRLAYD